MICKDCGASQLEGTLFCSECGCFLLDAPSKPTFILPFSDFAKHDPTPALENFKPSALAKPLILTIVIPSSRRRFKMEIVDRIRIGRADIHANIYPELDLVNDNGAEMGVSREHAIIEASANGLAVSDLGSTNGTFLNNSRLSPNMRYPLKNGDELRFGELLIHVLF